MDIKGKFNGKCSRSACLALGATWYNHSTNAFYCKKCAKMINSANREDAHRIWGHELCTEGKPETPPTY